MRSDRTKQGLERAPHRALLKATGVTEADMCKPFIAVCNSYIDIRPRGTSVRDGDTISIDLSERRIDLAIPSAEFELRLAVSRSSTAVSPASGCGDTRAWSVAPAIALCSSNRRVVR